MFVKLENYAAMPSPPFYPCATRSLTRTTLSQGNRAMTL